MMKNMADNGPSTSQQLVWCCNPSSECDVIPPRNVSGDVVPTMNVSGDGIPPRNVSGDVIPPRNVSGDGMPLRNVSGVVIPPRNVTVNVVSTTRGWTMSQDRSKKRRCRCGLCEGCKASNCNICKYCKIPTLKRHKTCMYVFKLIN
ncbi:uncharacterized protein [Dysidea avara]|uniref:uncharacterized protein isoform X6 n=1 Tax=Dysidea avara TaxID=196820 RepID=UPI003319865B